MQTILYQAEVLNVKTSNIHLKIFSKPFFVELYKTVIFIGRNGQILTIPYGSAYHMPGNVPI